MISRYKEDEFSLECEDLWEDWSKIEYDPINPSDYINYKLIPINAFPFDEQNCVMYNHIVSCLKGSYLGKIERGASGGIKASASYKACYDIRQEGGCIEITVCNYKGYSFRFQMRNSAADLFQERELMMSGGEAYLHFKDYCKKFGINLNDYAENDKKKAKENKNAIPTVHIGAYDDTIYNKVYRDAHHIDFHSSFMSGLIITHPEFKNVVEHIYNMRKSSDIKYKAILNMTQGYMQSRMVGYRFAHLAKDMITNNNERVEALAETLWNNGRVVLLFNTDGIWYQGDVYHGPGEGKGLGEWSNDHTDCIFRAKSSGAYEYIENGQYYPVVRGKTLLDRIKPRSDWKWGDIYREDASSITYAYDKGYLLWDGERKGVIDYAEESES